MKRIFAIVLCLIMSVSILSSCLAISAEVESGEIKARVSDLGTTADSLFRTNKTRSISVVMLIIDLADKLNDGPLDVSSILAPARYGCWIGITDNKKNLIVISPYDEQKSIITIDYNPKGIIKYYMMLGSKGHPESALSASVRLLL